MFIGNGNQNAENEDDFIDSLMVGLLFSCNTGRPDEFYNYKVRRLVNFKQDLFNEKKPLVCNRHFHFEYFTEESVFKKQCFAFINTKKLKIVPVELNEVTEVFSLTEYHYREKECRCCSEENLKISDKMKGYLNTS